MKRALSILVPSILAGCPCSYLPPATSDGGTSVPDVHSSCPGEISWEDSILLFEPAAHTTPAITGHATGFSVIGVERGPTSYSTHVATLSLTGPVTSAPGFALAAFAPPSTSVPHVFASTDPLGQPHVAAWVDGTLFWASPTDFDLAEASTRVDRLLGAVAFEENAVLVESHAESDGFIETGVTRYRDDGSSERIDRLRVPYALRPALANTAEGPWLGVLREGAPALYGPSGGWSSDSACDGGYDMVAESGEEVVLSQDCGGEVLFDRGRYNGFAHDRSSITGRDPLSTIPSRLASDGHYFALIYRTPAGARVAILDITLRLFLDEAVPDEAVPESEGPGTFAIAAAPWNGSRGTFAVLITTFASPELPGQTRYYRFAVVPTICI